jgi:GNAT superfamily N-acetyltransferase
MFATSDYILRPLTSNDEGILWEMLYLALTPADADPPPREIMREPQFARYVEGWGAEGDQGFLAAEKHGILLGAVWLRSSLGSGRADSPIELPFVVRPGHRQRGIGASLLTQMIRANPTLAAVSLRSKPGSSAVRLFGRFGFDVAREEEGAVIMSRNL